MFFMKTKKRVKKLEEHYENLKKAQESFLDDLSDLKYILNDIENKLAIVPERRNTNNTDSAEIKELVKKLKYYIDDQIESNKKNQISVNDVCKMLNENNTQILDQINSTVERLAVKPTVSVDYDRINQQIVLAVQQAYSSDNRIAYLNGLLNAEIEKNKQLENSMEQLKQRINTLEKNKSCIEQAAVPSFSTVSSSDNVINKELVSDTAPTQVNYTPLFNDNYIRNMKMLNNIIENAVILQNRYSGVLSEREENSIYFKTIDNCLKKLQKLSDKLSASEMESSQIVGELVKILNSTIIKNFVKKELYPLIDEFMINCRFIKKELEVGKKLGDDDYDYIGEMPLDVPVDSPEKHNRILSKEHDAYVIYYKDEDGLSCRIIDGKYSIGKYSN